MDKPATIPVEVMGYLDDVRQLADERRPDILSVLLFGSLAIGGFSQSLSDVDLLVVLADDVPRDVKRAISRDLEGLEHKHGFRDERSSRSTR